MKLIALILLGLLAVWWGILTLWAISCYRDRVRLAAKWTPENEAEYQKEMKAKPFYTPPKDYTLLPFIIFFFLPFYLWDWFVPDPFKNHDDDA